MYSSLAFPCFEPPFLHIELPLPMAGHKQYSVGAVSRLHFIGSWCGPYHVSRFRESSKITGSIFGIVQLRLTHSLDIVLFYPFVNSTINSAIMTGPSPQDMTPDFIAYSNGPTLLAQVAPIYAIAALVVLGRCYVRAIIVKSFRWDDWTMVACLVSILVLSTADKAKSYSALRYSQQCVLRHM
jgi:hypothetical protein